MKTPRIAGAICALLALALPACSPTDVAQDLAIRTDTTEYRLQQAPGGYALTAQVAVTNPLDRTVFLHRHCGGGEDPATRLIRPHGDTTRVELGGPGCIGQAADREPIPLQSGETYRDQVELWSSDSPRTQPPITMDMRTGEFMLVYDVQLTNAVDGWHAVDPLPRQRTTSNRFVVLPPE